MKWRDQVQIPFGQDDFTRFCAYTVLQTVECAVLHIMAVYEKPMT